LSIPDPAQRVHLSIRPRPCHCHCGEITFDAEVDPNDPVQRGHAIFSSRSPALVALSIGGT
jgi:hypothetical protein